MFEETPTIEEIRGTIGVARDSVWVIESTIQELTNGRPADNNRKGNIERNVSHLKIIVANPHVSGSGEDISDLHAAIALGEAKLAENIWPPE